MSLNNLCGVYIQKLRKLVTYQALPYDREAVRLSSAVAVLVALTVAHAHAEPRDTWFDLPVRDGWRTLETYGVARDERALALTLIARQPADRDRDVTEPSADATGAQPSVSIPVPLSDAAWR